MKRLALICALFSIVACSAASEDPTGTASQAVTAADWSSMQTSNRSGSPSEHLCLNANGPLAAGTSVLLAPCGATQIGTSFTLVPSNSGVSFGAYTPNVRIEAKTNGGALSGFCVAPSSDNASTVLEPCASSSTSLGYEWGAVFTAGTFLCLQNEEDVSGQLEWGGCTTANTGWEPANMPCFFHAATSPGTLYASTGGARSALVEEPPSSTVVDGIAQPTAAEQFCMDVATSQQTSNADIAFTTGPCSAFNVAVQEVSGSPISLAVKAGVGTSFNFNRANIPGQGWDGQIADNSGNCWEETSSAGAQNILEACAGASSESTWEIICAGH